MEKEKSEIILENNISEDSKLKGAKEIRHPLDNICQDNISKNANNGNNKEIEKSNEEGKVLDEKTDKISTATGKYEI